MRARRIVVVLTLTALFSFVFVPTLFGSDQITAPTTVGQTVGVTWQGTVLPGANPSSECTSTSVGADIHPVDIVVPAGAYASVAVLGTARVDYDGPVDLIVTVVFPDGRSVSGDNGFVNTDESTTFSNPASGTYQIIACAFAGAVPQPYSGTLSLTASAPPPPQPASCNPPGKPMTFAEPAYVDMHRAGGEPSIVAHPDGKLLYAAHAGTTHFYSLEVDDPTTSAFFENYRGQVYTWYSADHGATWTYVDRDLPPDNAPMSGFSDPDFAIDAAGNVYLSEINLANVAMSKSTSSGTRYTLQNFVAQTVTDRQWSAAGPSNMVFLVGNPSGGGTFPTDPVGHTVHTIYRSTDGGKTFSTGVDDDGGLGDIVFDQGRKTLFEAHYDGSTLEMASFRKATDPVSNVALTPEMTTIATGVSMLSHWPAIDVDAKGNVYITWDESGNGSRAAGIWYAASASNGRTWSAPVRVDADDRTDIWPWIAVGDAGRVAVAWFGNDHTLPNHDAEASTADDPWNVYAAQTLSGLGCIDSSAAGFRVTRVTPEPFHVDTVCMGGTTCQAFLIDRRLGDYFTIDVDTTGALVFAYSDTRQGGAVALPAFVRQLSGPSFNKGAPIKSK